MKKLPKAWDTWRSIPKNDPRRLAKLVAEGNRLEAIRRHHEAQAEAIKAEVTALKKFMLDNFVKDDLRSIVTSSGSARLVPKTIYQPDMENGGWEAIWKYIFKTKAIDLLQKRLHEGAVKARYEDGKTIPGVKTFDMVILKFGDAE